MHTYSLSPDALSRLIWRVFHLFASSYCLLFFHVHALQVFLFYTLQWMCLLAQCCSLLPPSQIQVHTLTHYLPLCSFPISPLRLPNAIFPFWDTGCSLCLLSSRTEVKQRRAKRQKILASWCILQQGNYLCFFHACLLSFPCYVAFHYAGALCHPCSNVYPIKSFPIILSPSLFPLFKAPSAGLTFTTDFLRLPHDYVDVLKGGSLYACFSFVLTNSLSHTITKCLFHNIAKYFASLFVTTSTVGYVLPLCIIYC